jgi:PadR family transcriptional regulator, regulatory protein AphA
MSERLSGTSYAVLGLLSISPMSGYDLAQSADRSIANFWPVAKSQVYAELTRLSELGFVRSTEVAQDKLPDKRVHELTPQGAAALDAWLESPGYERSRSRQGFLLKTFFGHRMSSDRFRSLVDEYRREAQAEAEHLARIVELLDEVPEAFFARATALMGLRAHEAVLGWADEVGASIPSASTPPTANVKEVSRDLLLSAPDRRKPA